MSGFLNLPPELRLNVYNHLLITSIADGRPANAAGLLFTCHIVYNEMRADFILGVATALSALHQWTSLYSESPLKIQLPHDHGFRHPPTRAIVSFPFGAQWHLVGNFQHALIPAVSSLKQFLSQPWDCLNLRVYYPFTSRFLVTMDDVDAVFRTLFKFMEREKDTDEMAKPYFSETRRLVICVDTSSELGTAESYILASMSSFYKGRLRRLFEPGSARHASSITKKRLQDHVTRSLGFNLDMDRDWQDH